MFDCLRRMQRIKLGAPILAENISKQKLTLAGLIHYEGNPVVAGQTILNEAVAMARCDESALEVAVREHARLVYRVAYSVLRNHHDAEDATQETFMRVLRYGRKLKAVEDRKAWLARIAWRVAITRRKKLPEVPLDDVEASVEQLRSSLARSDDILVTEEMSALLGRLIEGLPAQLRDVVALSTLQDMASAEIAAILEVPEAAVRSRLFRARQILKKKLTAFLEKKHGV